MLQVQLLVPSISADATVTANMKRDEELELELTSDIKVMAATSEQKISMKYGNVIFHLLFLSDYCMASHCCHNCFLNRVLMKPSHIPNTATSGIGRTTIKNFDPKE